MPRRGSKRTTRWLRFAPATNALVDGTAEQAAVLGPADTLVGATVLRVVGNIAFHGTTVDVAQRYVCGLLVGPSTLDAADTDPAVAGQGLDWLYWNAVGTNNPAYDGVDSFVGVRWNLDLRGRRKFTEGDVMFYCETLTGSGGNSYANFSVLVLNP